MTHETAELGNGERTEGLESAQRSQCTRSARYVREPILTKKRPSRQHTHSAAPVISGVSQFSGRPVGGRHCCSHQTPHLQVQRAVECVGDFGGGWLERPRPWRGVQWPGLALGVPRCPEPPGPEEA